MGLDIFFGGILGDVVVGGEDVDNLDQDVFDLIGLNVDFIIYILLDNEDGVVIFDDGLIMIFLEIENVILCFIFGILIVIVCGECFVEDL